jgi:TetR/AcrR family transcriptional repressor of lmrAB and yxaGH operons
MARATGTKDRLVATTRRLLWNQGYSATGMNQIIAESETPRGSVYFHFPGGKESLAIEALREAGRAMTDLMRTTLEKTGDVAGMLHAHVEYFARSMERSNWQRGCPIATVTLEAAALSEPIRRVCEEAFADWTGLMSDRLVQAGVEPERARELATIVLSAVEGALVLCRAQRDTKPLELVADSMAGLLAAETPNPARGRR